MTHPLQWFLDRIRKTVVMHEAGLRTEDFITIIDESHARTLSGFPQPPFTFRDPHPLTSSILTCNVLRCDECGKIGTTENLDKEVAAKGFEGEGWKLLMDGTINCGCK